MRSAELPSAIHVDIRRRMASVSDPVAAAWAAFREIGATALDDLEPESYDLFQVEGGHFGGLIVYPDEPEVSPSYRLMLSRITFVYEASDHVGENETHIEILLPPDVGLPDVLESVVVDAPDDLAAFFARWESSADARDFASHGDRAGHPRVVWNDLDGGGAALSPRGLPRP